MDFPCFLCVVGGTKQYVKIGMSIQSDSTAQDDIVLQPANSKEARESLATVYQNHMKAAQRGVANALSAGPLLSFPVT